MIMSNYFSNFPIVDYTGVKIRDILRRTGFVEENLSNPYVFLPYTVKEGEKPEDIAYNYYGTVDATWLVLLANGITDPYTGWPLSEELFSEYLIKKYEVQSGKKGYEIVSWTQNETTDENILYYRKVTGAGKNILVTPESFAVIYVDDVAVGRAVEPGYSPYRIYDYERDENDNKREILVIENRFYQQIAKEFKKLIRS